MTTGSIPVFPNIIYNYSLPYVINLVNITKANKFLYIDLLVTKKTFRYIKLLKNLNYIFRYNLYFKNNKTYARIFVYYWKNGPVGYNFKLMSKPSQYFFVSLKALHLIAKRTGNAVYIISTSKGLLTHRTALKQKLGGYMVGFFII